MSDGWLTAAVKLLAVKREYQTFFPQDSVMEVGGLIPPTTNI